MLPTKFRFIWQSGFREEDFLEIDQSATRIICGGHVRGPSKDASYQISIHFGQVVTEENIL